MFRLRCSTALAIPLISVAFAGCSGSSSSGDGGPIDSRDDISDTGVIIDGRPQPDAAISTCDPVSGTDVDVEDVASGFDSPLLVTSPPGDRRLFIVEQAGLIKIVEGTETREQEFLDLRADSDGPVFDQSDEQGLLGLAFHPNYAQNGRFYVFYTRTHEGPGNDDYDNVVAEYQVSADPNVANPDSGRVLLAISDFASNHNGGTIEFGPDGFLYIGSGDGGDGGDPEENGQDDRSLLGKMLRIDVDSTTGDKEYDIPIDNPFADSEDGDNDPRPEIWAKGLRNPYRFTFDRTTGDLYIGDVGQDVIEEIDVWPAAGGPGANFGWDTWEADECFEGPCQQGDLIFPVTTHTRNAGWRAIIGGQVYRGTCFPDLVGTYFYSDNQRDEVWTFRFANGEAQGDAKLPASDEGGMGSGITSIHEDALGELYITTRGGSLRRIVVTP